MKHIAVLPLAVVGLMVGTAIVSAQTFTNLYLFSVLEGGTPETNTDGQAPYGNLFLSGGTLYGTTYNAGSNGSGSVFAINTNGSNFTVLHSFSALVGQTNADGAHPYSGLAMSGGTLYGTTFQGGTNSSGSGTVFSLNTNGTGFTVLHTFTNGLDGAQPHAELVLLGNALYGTTTQGGSNGLGTIFSVTTNGTTFNSLHSFNNNVEGGSARAGLTLSGGVLCGTTYNGGSNSFGAVFSINPDGTGFTVLHTFAYSLEGGFSEAPLAVSGNTLFGTTSAGGTDGWGTVFALNGANCTVLHTFTGEADGGVPAAGLAVSGNTLYGTAQDGGAYNYGTIFSVRTNGAGFFVLHALLGATDGSNPSGGLAMAGKMAFGTTTFGGIPGNNGGTIYSISVPVLSISGLALSGTNAVINAADGLSNGTYSVLMSTNPALPLSQWTPAGTITLTANGSFVITATNGVNPSASQQFYILQMQ